MVFDLLRRRWQRDDVILCAFDLLELDGKDLRRAPIEERKAALAKLLRADSAMALPSMSTIAATARSSTSTLAPSAARASYRSG